MLCSLVCLRYINGELGRSRSFWDCLFQLRLVRKYRVNQRSQNYILHYPAPKLVFLNASVSACLWKPGVGRQVVQRAFESAHVGLAFVYFLTAPSKPLVGGCEVFSRNQQLNELVLLSQKRRKIQLSLLVRLKFSFLLFLRYFFILLFCLLAWWWLFNYRLGAQVTSLVYWNT